MIYIYKTENNFKNFVKMMCALSYVPIKYLKNEIEKIEKYFEKNTFYSEFQKIFLWFKKTYGSNVEDSNLKRYFRLLSGQYHLKSWIYAPSQQTLSRVGIVH
ncbi:hypothetical protein DMUE_1340 [Dictyocoela muelleri]|nr:hypothetical protein DMUE_1340 [Dictyocoela muelleri]